MISFVNLFVVQYEKMQTFCLRIRAVQFDPAKVCADMAISIGMADSVIVSYRAVLRSKFCII